MWELDNRKSPIEHIQLIKARWEKAKFDLAEAQYLEELIHLDYLNSIRNCKTAWSYRIPMIKAAVDELSIKDKRRKRENLKYLNSAIKQDFFHNMDVKISIEKIIRCGYEAYGWQLKFDLNNKGYSIFIPDLNELDLKNLSYAHYGMFAFAYEKESNYTVVEYQSYSIEDMSNFISDYFNKTASEENK